jgi:glycine cleavage system H protein
MDPKTLRFSKEHEWVAVEGGTATIGISDHAQSELGDIVFVELPEVGREVAAGEVIGTIESVKAVSELYSPVSGAVIAVNDALDQAPDAVNREPYGDGWILKVELSDPGEIDALMDHAAYGEFTG